MCEIYKLNVNLYIKKREKTLNWLLASDLASFGAFS